MSENISCPPVTPWISTMAFQRNCKMRTLYPAAGIQSYRLCTNCGCPILPA